MKGLWEGYKRHRADVAMMLAAFALFAAVGLFGYTYQSRNESRDISCFASEGAHRVEVEELRQAYDLFLNPPPDIKRFVEEDPRAIASVIQVQRDARFDNDEYGVFVAPWCDDEGYGQPEPDPVLPEKPEGIP